MSLPGNLIRIAELARMLATPLEPLRMVLVVLVAGGRLRRLVKPTPWRKPVAPVPIPPARSFLLLRLLLRLLDCGRCLPDFDSTSLARGRFKDLLERPALPLLLWICALIALARGRSALPPRRAFRLLPTMPCPSFLPPLALLPLALPILPQRRAPPLRPAIPCVCVAPSVAAPPLAAPPLARSLLPLPT